MSKSVYGQFVYLKESFCPSLDEKISVLYEVRSPHKPGCVMRHLHLTKSCTCVLLKTMWMLFAPAGLWERGSPDCQLRKRTCLGLITSGQVPEA